MLNSTLFRALNLDSFLFVDKRKVQDGIAWATVVHLNFRARSTFPIRVCTVPSSMDRTSLCNKIDAVRLYAAYLLILKGQRCVIAINRTSCHSLNGGSIIITFYSPVMEQKINLFLHVFCDEGIIKKL